MKITVNQCSYSVPEICSLQQLLNDVIGESATGITIAVNEEVIAKNSWAGYLLLPDDNINIIKTTQADNRDKLGQKNPGKR
ncbi:MAG: hypothetical protein NVSMB24_38260 [Mucilaginibacter sp.]